MKTSAWARVSLHLLRTWSLARKSGRGTQEASERRQVFAVRAIEVGLTFTLSLIALMGAGIVFGLQSRGEFDPTVSSFATLLVLTLWAVVTFACWFNISATMFLTGIPAGRDKAEMPMPTLPIGIRERGLAVGLAAWVPACAVVLSMAACSGLVGAWIVSRTGGEPWQAWNPMLTALCVLLILLPSFVAAGFAEGSWHEPVASLVPPSRPGRVLVILTLLAAPPAAVLGVASSLPLALCHALVGCLIVLSTRGWLDKFLDARGRALSGVVNALRGSAGSALFRPGLLGLSALNRDAWLILRRDALTLLAVLVVLSCLDFWPLSFVRADYAFLVLALWLGLWFLSSQLDQRSRSPRLDASSLSLDESPWDRLPLRREDIARVLHQRIWFHTLSWAVAMTVVMHGLYTGPETLRGAEALGLFALFLLVLHVFTGCLLRGMKPLGRGSFPLARLVLLAVLSYWLWTWLQFCGEFGHEVVSRTTDVLLGALGLCALSFGVAFWKRADARYFLVAALVPALLQLNLLISWSAWSLPCAMLALGALTLVCLRWLYRAGLELQLSEAAQRESRDEADS